MVTLFEQFILLVIAQIGCGYVLQAQGEILTPELLMKFIENNGRKYYYFISYSAEKWFGKICYDCSGLIIWALQKMGVLSNIQDYNADNIYKKLCKPISKSELKRGDLCFQDKDGVKVHVGMYVGNNRVVHARGTNYGVVETSLFSSFNTFGRLICFMSDPNTTTKSWEQNTGEKAIDILAKNGLITNPEDWKKRDLKNEPTPLWLTFEMMKRLNEKNK